MSRTRSIPADCDRVPGCRDGAAQQATQPLRFRKVGRDGSAVAAVAPLGSGAGEWVCTADLATGLVWEVKTSDGGFRDQRWTYSWFDSKHNYGNWAGLANGGQCSSPDRCDTEKYVADVNAERLCGAGDWRMPTAAELLGLVDLDAPRGYGSAVVSPLHFPNTPASNFWSGSPDAGYLHYAWAVSFARGSGVWDYRAYAYHVRLVRQAR